MKLFNLAEHLSLAQFLVLKSVRLHNLNILAGIFTMIINKIYDLPEKIQSVISKINPKQEISCAIKTLYKPNSTIPYIWLIATKTHLLMCNTHQTRGLFKILQWSQISDIQYKQGGLGDIVIKIIFTDIEEPDLLLQLESNISQDDVKIFISNIPE